VNRKAFSFILFITFFLGCATTGPMAPLDMSAPGWEVRQGQAIWRPDNKKPEIAGEIVLATNPNGNSYVQFSKTIPIVSAQSSPDRWEAEFSPENKHYSGSGAGPARLVWVQLLRAIEGRELKGDWRLIHPSNDFIALEDDDSGERLEVHFQH
jgi:hypothetical protein